MSGRGNGARQGEAQSKERDSVDTAKRHGSRHADGLPPCRRVGPIHRCGCSSVVELLPSKQNVVGSNPIARSNFSPMKVATMKLIIDRAALQRKILEDDYDGEVEAGHPGNLELLVQVMKRQLAASDEPEADGKASEG